MSQARQSMGSHKIRHDIGRISGNWYLLVYNSAVVKDHVGIWTRNSLFLTLVTKFHPKSLPTMSKCQLISDAGDHERRWGLNVRRAGRDVRRADRDLTLARLYRGKKCEGLRATR